MTDRKKKLLVLCGPSAVGKTVIAERIRRFDCGFSFIRSVTTRAPRGDGHDGEYIYLDEDEFLRMAECGEILEHMEYAGKLYGTPRSELDRVTDEGGIPLLILDLNGVKSLAAFDGFSPCCVYVFDSLDNIDRRLRARYLENSDGGAGSALYIPRQERNISDYLSLTEFEPYFYAFVENDSTVDSCARRVLDIFRAFDKGEEKNREKTRSLSLSLRKMAEDML